ncbi:MAG: MBL fold metallo-hydrolase [Candidatus Izimaplasma sp.]|nr:MBL fold metallo-hydrolase [Candidatus Izimaplasma bacterium]
MKITTLIENDTIDQTLKAAHGLSLFVETKNHKIIMDLGPNNIYIKNAKQLGIDVTSADMLVISHGHNDHGSGLKKFMKINKQADIFVSRHAFDGIVKKQNNDFIKIGIKKPRQRDRLTLVNQDITVKKNIHIFSNINFEQHPLGDDSLYIYEHHQYQPDHFSHEIFLVIEEDDHVVLFSGCSHKGIENIINSIEEKLHKSITDVVAGFHFSHYNAFDVKQTDYLQKLGKRFNDQDRSYYACHCTGDDAFFELKQQLKSKLHRLKTGSIINL